MHIHMWFHGHRLIGLMKIRQTLLLFVIASMCCCALHAQVSMESLVARLKTFGVKLPQEQVFLHMDNSSYYLGDTIYYKAYVKRSDNGRPTNISGILYCELLNNDGFLDEPNMLQFNLSNRWLYQADNGVQVRFGVRAIQDNRKGGQLGSIENPWETDILNRSLNGYLKVGVPLNEDNSQNIALIADYSYQDMDSFFGMTDYVAGQHSAFANLLYQNVINDSHRFTLGLNGTFDRYDENIDRLVSIGRVVYDGITDLANAGVFGEYTFHAGETFSVAFYIYNTNWAIRDWKLEYSLDMNNWYGYDEASGTGEGNDFHYR